MFKAFIAFYLMLAIAPNGELNLDQDYYQGDIVLTEQQQDYISKTHMNDGLYSRAISSDMTKLWPSGVVRTYWVWHSVSTPYIGNECLRSN